MERDDPSSRDLPLPLLLASRSPRRSALLRDAGIRFETGAFPDVDETPDAGDTPEQIVRALARRKADAASRQAPGRTVLTADTLVFRDGRPLGKPRDERHAAEMLQALAGRDHEVCTGVALARRDESGALRLVDAAETSTVRFDALTPAEIGVYVAGGEPLDKAGAYAIQGEAAAFARVVSGGLDNVIGLPIGLVRALLEAADWAPAAGD